MRIMIMPHSDLNIGTAYTRTFSALGILCNELSFIERYDFQHDW